MKYALLSYGKEGWDDRMRMVESIISSRPKAPFLYDDVLIVVPSVRMKRMYGRLFLNALMRVHKASALVQPEVLTFHQLLAKLYHRLHGPRVLDEDSRLVLLEGIVKDLLNTENLFQQDPDLLAPSLSSALARMIEQLAAAGITPERLISVLQDADFFHKPQIRLLIEGYIRYQSVLNSKSLTDPAGMRTSLVGAFDSSWFSGYRDIIIDSIQDANKHERDILQLLADLSKCVFLVEAPSQTLLFRAKEFHPLWLTKDFVSGLGGVQGPKEPASNVDDLFVASSLFSEQPFEKIANHAPPPSAFSKKMRVLSTVNTLEEVSLIASMVKKSIRNGTAADGILVSFPSLDEYGTLVEEIFADYGIPYNRALGRPLSTSPVTVSLVSLFGACQEDFSAPSLLRIFNSPFLKFGSDPALAPSLDRSLRSRRIIGGREKIISTLRLNTVDEREGSILAGPLEDLFDALKPFVTHDASPLTVWMDRLNVLLAWSGLGDRVETVHGPLNINLQAYRKLIETHTRLTSAGLLFPDYTYTFYEWMFLLRKTFMRTRFQVPPEDEEGVQILGIQESIGRPWKEIYFGGLTDVAFPQRQPQNIFLPETILERLGLDTPERDRVAAARHFYRLLLSAESITLTYPENEGDRPVVPSPFLSELSPFKTAGLLNRGIDKTTGIQFSLKIEDSQSLAELEKSIGVMSSTAPGWNNSPQADELLRDVSNRVPGLFSAIAGVKSALEDKPAEWPVILAATQKRKFRVTELDNYLACPYDYYVKYILGTWPLEEVTEDISPVDRGSKVHAILRNFYLSWNGPVSKTSRKDATALLKALADSAFDKEAETVRNRREKELFLKVMVERFLDAEEAFWEQGMRPVYLEQTIESFKLALSNGQEVFLSAKIDRIDADTNGNFFIVDYKTGVYPQPKMNLEQDIFQLPVYANMALTAIFGKEPALKKPVGLVYYDLSGKIGAHARDVVLYNRDAVNEQPAVKPKASPRSAEEFQQILNVSMDKARKAIESILAGDFRSEPQDQNKCRYCANGTLCNTIK